MGTGSWGAPVVAGYPSGLPPAMWMRDLGLSESIIHAFTDMLQGVVAAGLVVTLPSPSLATPKRRFTNLLILHLTFMCRLEGERDLPPILEAVVMVKGMTEGMKNLKQTLMRGIPSCCRVFGRGGCTSDLPTHPPGV